LAKFIADETEKWAQVKEINLCLDDPKITAVLADTYRMPLKGSQEAFARFVSSEIEKSAKAIRAANIRAE
jgi:hypothetical protein